MTGVVVCSIECGWSKVRAPHEGGKDFVFGCRAHLETFHSSESLSRFYEYRGYWDAVRLGDVDPNQSAWKNEYRVLSEGAAWHGHSVASNIQHDEHKQPHLNLLRWCLL